MSIARRTAEATVGEIRRVTLIGAALNLVLAAAKIGIGAAARSQALIADGVHSLSDLVTDAAVAFGAKYWSAPADQGHPYGHGRLETLVSIGISGALAAVACGIAWKALVSMQDLHPVPPSWLALAVAACSIVIKEALYHWTDAVGRRLHSRAVTANAWHHRSDALSSVPVVLAVLGSRIFPGLTYLDHIAALVVTVLLLRAAWEIGKPGLSEITEARGDRAVEKRAMETAQASPGILAVHAVRSRRIGGAVCLDLHMLVPPAMPVSEAHELAESLERRITEQEDGVAEVLVHIEPGPENMAPGDARREHGEDV